MIHCGNDTCPNLNYSSSKNLDEQFKKTCALLKPLLTSFKDKTYRLCAAWIKKLYECDDNEKVLRNKYILELWNQLSRGYLNIPYDVLPPKGKLQDIDIQCNWTSSEYSDTRNSQFAGSCTPNCRCECIKNVDLPLSPATNIESLIATENHDTEQYNSDKSMAKKAKIDSSINYRNADRNISISSADQNTTKSVSKVGEYMHRNSKFSESSENTQIKQYETNTNSMNESSIYDRKRDSNPIGRFRNDLRESIPSQNTFFNDGETYLKSDTASNPFESIDVDIKYIDASLQIRLAEMFTICDLQTKEADKVREEKVLLMSELESTRRHLDESSKKEAMLLSELESTRHHFAEDTMVEKSALAKIEAENDTLRRKIEQLQEFHTAQIQNLTTIAHNDGEKEDCKKIQAENMELREKIKVKAQELNNIAVEYREELMKLEEKHRQDVLDVIQENNEKIHEMEQSFNEQLRSYQKEHEKTMSSFSKGNNESLRDYSEMSDRIVAAKDVEIAHLETVIQEQCADLQSNVMKMQNKIETKCVNQECKKTRLELKALKNLMFKLKKPMENLFLHLDKGIFDIAKEQNVQETDSLTTNLNLLKQKAKITVKIFSESKAEIEEALNRLKCRHKRNMSQIQREIETSNSCLEKCCTKENLKCCSGCCKNSE